MLINEIINSLNFINLLNMIIPFEIGIITVFLPITIELLSRIFDKYNSQNLVNDFIKRSNSKLLNYLIIANFVFILILYIFHILNKLNNIKIVLFLVSISSFIIVLFFFLKDINLILKYIFNISYLINLFLINIKKIIKEKNLNINKFEINIENIVDILSYTVKNKKSNETIKSTLIEFFNIFNTLKNNMEKNENNIFFIVSQINKIYNTSLEYNNNDISKESIKIIINFLKILSYEDKNQTLIDKILLTLSLNMLASIKYEDSTMYDTSFIWYKSIVFNSINQKASNFKVVYLENYDQYLIQNVKYLIFYNKDKLFKELISSFYDGISIMSYMEHSIYNYINIFTSIDINKYNEINSKYEINNILKVLVKIEDNLNTIQKLDEWIKKFLELKDILKKNFNVPINNKFNENIDHKEKKLIEYIYSKYKYENLIGIIFIVCSICLYKKRYDFIKYIWEYKQPKDSTATWIGHDLIPTNTNKAIELYLQKNKYKNKVVFLEDHHQIELYLDKYFLLLLSKLIKDSIFIQDNYDKSFDKYLINLNFSELNQLKYECDKLIELKNEVINDKDYWNFLELKKSEEFSNILFSIINKLKESIINIILEKKRKEKINHNKVEKFKENVLFYYKKYSKLKDILKNYLNIFEDKTDEINQNKITRFGINQIIEKDFFIDLDDFIILGFEENCAQSLAIGEDSFLIEIISKNCRKKDLNDIIKNNLNINDFVIFSINSPFLMYNQNSNDFESTVFKDTKDIDIKAFSGWYHISNNIKIPVFDLYNQSNNKLVLLLNRNKIGKFIQYSPVNEKEDKNLVKDIFYMNIQSFSENNNLLEKTIKQSQKNIIKPNDFIDKKKYLEERVYVQILEKIDFLKSENFEGYIINIDN